MYNKSTQIIVYADDIVIVGRSIDTLKERVKTLIKAAQIVGLTVNVQKTKHMKVINKSSNTKMLKTDGQE